VDILKPVAKKAMRAENQTARYLIESDLDSAETGYRAVHRAFVY
jgi:hypothetical protein